MMKLHLYTRSYIDNSNSWVLSDKLIDSYAELYSKLGSDVDKKLTWTVLVSGLSSPEYLSDLKLAKMSVMKVNLINTEVRLSASQAREVLIKELAEEVDSEDTYYMNIDSDDYLANIDELVALIESDITMDSDLIAFGLDMDDYSYLSEKWNFSQEYFKKSRRYCTTETQTMFLFLHNHRVLEILSESHWLTSHSNLDPNESTEDFKLAVGLATYIFNNTDSNDKSATPILISAVMSNFIKYVVHEGQVSNNQTNEYKERLNSILKALGYLYVNHEFYKVINNKLIKFNPYNE